MNVMNKKNYKRNYESYIYIYECDEQKKKIIKGTNKEFIPVPFSIHDEIMMVGT